MGSGIAQALAMAGLTVHLFDRFEGAADKARTGIENSLKKLASKQKITEDEAVAALGRIEVCSSMSNACRAQVVVEAIVEEIAAKRALFAELDAACPPETLLLTNTSSLSVTEIANATGLERRGKVAGMHFFNPVPLMRLVEVVRTPFTTDTTFEAVWELAQRCGKSPVETRDTPGFLFNRLILPYLNEAIWAVYEGVGGIEEIDRAMILGGNMPIGPLSLLDLIGLDVQLHALSAMRDETGDPKYRPCPLNRQMVRAGYLGRKTGRGFYEYGHEQPRAVDLTVFRCS